MSIKVGKRRRQKRFRSIDFPAGVRELALSPGVTVNRVSFSRGSDTFWTDGKAIYSADRTELIRVTSPSLKSYTVQKGTVFATDYAFSGCKRLTQIILPPSFRLFRSLALRGLSGFLKIVGGENLTELPEGLFYECSGLIDARLPEKLRSLGEECFVNCRRLSVSLPDTLEEKDDRTFMKWEIKPGEIVLPASVRTVGIGAFAGCAEVVVTESEGISGIDWSCACQITVKSSSTGKILYKVPLRLNGQSPEFYEMLQDCFKGGTHYDFARMDKLFARIKGVEARFRVALTRLAYPESMPPKSREMYAGYVRQMGMKIATACIENGDLEGLRAAAEFGAVKRSNIDKLVEAAAQARQTEITAFLLDFKNKNL